MISPLLPFALWAAALAGSAFAARPPDPFEPLTSEEIAAAVGAIRASGKVGADALFPYVVLEEPAKADWKAGRPVPRVAWANVLEGKERLSEWRVDLRSRRIIGSRAVERGQAPILPHEYVELPDLVRKDPGWRKAIEKRGITNFDDVMIDIWAAGPFLDREREGRRMARAVAYLKAGFTNPYSHPIEVTALIDVSRGEVVEVHDSGALGVSRRKDDFDADSVARETPVQGPPPAPPARESFRVDGNVVAWNGWVFRYALHPREGLVLYTISHRGRSILHRASLSEMIVPYADPDENWVWRNAFDVGEYGEGRMTSPQEPGGDTPPNARLLDAEVADEFGKVLRVPRAVAVFERDGGVLWRHQDALAGRTDSRRAWELVIQFVATISNYDYLLAWVFRQDGSIELEARLTGIMLAKSVDPGSEAHAGHVAHAVAPGIFAVHHQHFFNFRLDFDVDGEKNSVSEINLRPLPPGHENPYGNVATMEETPLGSEKAAARDMALASQRKWKISSASRKNALGQSTAYLLVPGETSVGFLSEDSPVRAKAAFIDHQFWATRERPGENYAAGDYPNQGPPGEGLPRFIADDEPLEGRDVVVWYTFGVTHAPRPEEWPVMPAHKTGFRIIPAGFFDRNPALGPQR